MAKQTDSVRIALPRGWCGRVRSGMLHVISLAQFALTYTRSWAVNSPVARVRLKARNSQLRQQVVLLTQEIRIKDARMERIAPQRRRHYVPTERMSILELRAARGWSTQQTADARSASEINTDVQRVYLIVTSADAMPAAFQVLAGYTVCGGSFRVSAPTPAHR